MNVARSSDAGVSLITVDGVDVTVSKAFTALVGSSSVAVTVQTVDAGASYVVLGASGLQGGSNSVTVRVTAADGVTVQDYVVSVSVPVLSSDKSLASLTVDGVAIQPGGSVSKVFGTSSVVVSAVASDVNAEVFHLLWFLLLLLIWMLGCLCWVLLVWFLVLML
ncbi:MAG: hypothetical protein EBY29_13295 [Planctomycetes bacterium]|nr:hypothetical protein [Planctomycetota bacterium]